jgi:hypothetical protein
MYKWWKTKNEKAVDDESVKTQTQKLNLPYLPISTEKKNTIILQQHR